MTNPQTLALELSRKLTQERLKIIGDNACCAFVCMWCMGIEPTDIEAVRLVSDAMDAGVLEKDCTVKWTEFCKWLTGKTYDVEFKPVRELRGIIDRTPVRYDYKGKGHWVGVERGMICFNPLKTSRCVEKGTPVTSRILKLSGSVK